MRTFVTNGELWRVIRVDAGDPRLFDRTGTERLATTNPSDHLIAVSRMVEPPLLDRVLLHEIAHAMTISWGLLPSLHEDATRGNVIGIEEWAARLMENHAIDAVIAASEVLGRPVCVRGACV